MESIDTMDPMNVSGLFDFTPSAIFAGIIFSVIGYYLYREGKKRVHYPWIGSGVALMTYSLFVSGPLADWGIGFALCGVAYYFR